MHNVATSFEEVGKTRSCHANCREKIELNQLAELLRRDFSDETSIALAGAVHEHVKASVHLHRFGDERFDLVLLRDICWQPAAFAVGCRKRRCRGRELLLMTTFAPAPTSARAITSPSPFEPPVTSAILLCQNDIQPDRTTRDRSV